MKQQDESPPDNEKLDAVTGEHSLDEWFAAPSTWKPPRLRQSSRPPSAPPPSVDEDIDDWFV